MYIFKTISVFKKIHWYSVTHLKESREKERIYRFHHLKIKLLSLPGFESPLPNSNVGFLRMSHSFNYFSSWRKKLSVTCYFENRSSYGRCWGSSERCRQGQNLALWKQHSRGLVGVPLRTPPGTGTTRLIGLTSGDPVSPALWSPSLHKFERNERRMFI